MPHLCVHVSLARHLAEQDFLDKRKQTWEDSLRSLYSMFRVKQFETFYGTHLDLHTAYCGQTFCQTHHLSYDAVGNSGSSSCEMNSDRGCAACLSSRGCSAGAVHFGNVQQSERRRRQLSPPLCSTVAINPRPAGSTLRAGTSFQSKHSSIPEDLLHQLPLPYPQLSPNKWLQDVPFTMPLCGKGGEAVSMEEIQELREYERSNPGQVSTPSPAQPSLCSGGCGCEFTPLCVRRADTAHRRDGCRRWYHRLPSALQRRSRCPRLARVPHQQQVLPHTGSGPRALLANDGCPPL